MAAIEGKSQKIRGEIEAIHNHRVLNENKLKFTQEEINRLKAVIAQIDGEQIECD